MKIKWSNIFKAGASTLLGGLILVGTTVVTSLQEGQLHWKPVLISAAIAVFLAVTDMFKEAKKQIDNQKEDNE